MYSKGAKAIDMTCNPQLKEKKNDMVVGKHVNGSLYNRNREKAYNEELLKNAVIEAAKLANMQLVEVKSWSFGGRKGGVSVIALVVESHVSVHTWPLYGYATVDMYTCGEKSDPWKAFRHILKILEPQNYEAHYADRSMVIK